MQHLFGPACHTAFVVPDFDRAVSRMLDSGLGPAFTLKNLSQPASFRGERHDMVMNVAFFCVGGVFFEYIEQLDESRSAYSEFLKTTPQGGMHHIAYYSSDFQADMARAAAAGVTLEVVEELFTPDGTLMELYTHPAGRPDAVLTQFMYGGPNLAVFATMERVAREWDGRTPTLSLFDLLPDGLDLSQA